MKVRVPDYYDNFKCIAGACTDTCCAGWQVDVDDDSFAYYKTIEGSFGELLHSVMVEGKKGEEGQFIIRPDGRCPFLNDGNLCDLYTALGKEALCRTCEQYPRFTTEYGNIRETGIALSCITAAELILKDNRTPGFVEFEDKEAYPQLNNIDAELYFALVKARDRIYEICADRKYDIWDRMTAVTFFATDLQKNIRKITDFQKITDKYTDEYIEAALTAAHRETFTESDICDIYKKYYYSYLKLVIIKKEWPKLVDEVYDSVLVPGHNELGRIFSEYSKEFGYELENAFTYFIYRYFLKAVFDKDVLTKVKIAVVSVLLIYQCEIAEFISKGKKLTFDDRVNIMHLYSREVEHSEENFEKMCRNFRKMRVYSTKNLVTLLQANRTKD